MLDDEQMAEILKTLVDEHGFEPPIYLAVVGHNGSTATGRYQQQEDHLGFEILSQNIKDNIFALPLNIMFVDGKSGNAARVLLKGNEQPRYFLN